MTKAIQYLLILILFAPCMLVISIIHCVTSWIVDVLEMLVAVKESK